MTTRHFRASTILGAVAVALLLTTVLAAVGAATMLDAWIQRGGGSVNTIVPGFTYAAATVMKVALFEVVLLLVGAIVQWFSDRSSANAVPLMGVISVLATSFVILIGAGLVLVFQARSVDVSGLLIRSSVASRVAVLGMMGLLLLGICAGLFSLIRRERPWLVPVAGIASNFALVLIFRYFEFYKLGFDQDRWAE